LNSQGSKFADDAGLRGNEGDEQRKLTNLTQTQARIPGQPVSLAKTTQQVAERNWL
jgi:hypothetical protein